jgi:hypothetical protein
MNKKFVYQVGNNKEVILWCTANQSINSVKHAATLESNSFSSIWLACHSQNLKVHCCVHRNLLNHMLSQMSPLHVLIPCLRSVLILSLHICLSLPSGLLTKLVCELTFSPMHITCSTLLIPLYVITLEIFTPQVVITWIQMWGSTRPQTEWLNCWCSGTSIAEKFVVWAVALSCLKKPFFLLVSIPELHC